MKEILKSILTGATLGIVVWILSYLGVYYIEGQRTYEQEILQLTQGEVLQNQLIVVAIYGALIGLGIDMIPQFIKNEKKNVYKTIAGSVLFFVVELCMLFSIDYIGGFSENIKIMIVVSTVLVLAIYPLLKWVMISLEQFTINKKIKEKNAQEPEKGNS